MAEKKELEITIGPDGEVQVLVKCIKGASCIEETQVSRGGARQHHRVA